MNQTIKKPKLMSAHKIISKPIGKDSCVVFDAKVNFNEFKARGVDTECLFFNPFTELHPEDFKDILTADGSSIKAEKAES